MEIPDFPAITAFCRIIGELPEKARSTALGFTCNALGQRAQPTGLKVSPDRPIGHLYWSHEMADLYNRLIYLVETVGMSEQIVVQGAAAFVESHFARWADEEFSRASVAGFHKTIEKVQSQLALPIDRREGMQSVNELNEFRQKLDVLIDTAETRRHDAEETQRWLGSQFESVFTLQFWEGLSRLEIERSRPDVEKMLHEDEVEDA